MRDDHRHTPAIDLNRHGSEYRTRFSELSDEFHQRCPVAWNRTHGGHWLASGNRELFELVRQPDLLSNDNDVEGVKNGYQGISIPPAPDRPRGGFLEMDPPEQKHYRQALSAYLSPAAIARWQPVLDELTRACLDEVIETGSIDFIDDLANIVPAIFTLALLGMPLRDWEIYCEPTHAFLYTSPDSPDFPRVQQLQLRMFERMHQSVTDIRARRRPGLIDGLINAQINGAPPSDTDIVGAVALIIGGGFDTTTALTAHSLEWLSQHPAERERLSQEREFLLDSATEEFLRYVTPAQGDGRTFTRDIEINGMQYKEGERIWLSWAMANRDETVFENPHEIQLDRTGNRHSSFGLGIHRCIGSNVARSLFKTMIVAVLDRIPDFVCSPEGAVHYETIGAINGMRNLSTTFTPGTRLGHSLDETIDKIQQVCDEQDLAEPVTVRNQRAEVIW